MITAQETSQQTRVSGIDNELNESKPYTSARERLSHPASMDWLRLPNKRFVVTGCLAYVLLNQFLRYRRRRLINHGSITTNKVLDMNKVHTLFEHSVANFSWSMKKSLEFALFRTYSIPTISNLLERTSEFGDNAAKRGDDTGLILATIIENKPNDEEALRAIKRMNYIHDQYRGKISNDDFLYTLSVFVVCPIRWMQRYEWRSMSKREEEIHFLLWRDVGEKMGIDGIPPTLTALEAWAEAYEKEHMVYAKSNHVVAETTVKLLLSVVPSFLRAPARPVVYAMMDDRLRKAMGYPAPPRWLVATLRSLFIVRGWFVQWVLPYRPWPRHRTYVPKEKDGIIIPRFNSYPGSPYNKVGYRLKELGPKRYANRFGEIKTPPSGKCPVAFAD